MCLSADYCFLQLMNTGTVLLNFGQSNKKDGLEGEKYPSVFKVSQEGNKDFMSSISSFLLQA